MFLGLVTFLVAVSISGIAAYYSIAGLIAIFAGAVVPIIIMGGVIETGKILATIWLHQNWHRSPKVIRFYLVISVIGLMFLTSLGVFGFLSKAHIDQTASYGDNTVLIERLDKSITRQNKRIINAETQQQLLDDAIARYTEVGAISKGLAQRERQKKERASIKLEIENAQDEIAVLEDKRLEHEKNQLTMEAEVGPIKFIADMIYGEADRQILEQAVRWVIILIVVVLDPLAICLVLAATMQIQWTNQERKIRKAIKDGRKDIIAEFSPQLKELEMKLEQYNEIISELEKLIDDSLTKINPEELEKLQTEYDTMIAEKAEIEQVLLETKEEADNLIEKVLETEEERDEYKKRANKLTEGSGAFETRISDLLDNIKTLESEIDSRDAAVTNMAKKYQLVSKDTFPDEIIEEAKTEK